MPEPPQFQSKSASHILNYESVATAVHFALAYSVVSYAINNVVLPVWRLLDSTVLSVQPVKANAARVDAMFDQYVLLQTLDAKILPLSHLILARVVALISRFAQPVNHFLAYTVLDSVFKTKPPKLERDESQPMYTVTLLHALLSRVRQVFWQTLSTVTQSVLETYQHEIDAAKNTGLNPVKLNFNASFNTAAKSLHSLNASVIQPLRAQTLDYVCEITGRARSRSSDAAQSFEGDVKTAAAHVPTRA